MKALSMFGIMLLAGTFQSATAQERTQTDQSFLVEQTYWVKPGNERQFLSFYRKTELPRLERERQAGRILWVRLGEPLLSSGNDQWDLRVTIAWNSPASALSFSVRSAAEDSAAENQAGNIEATLRRALIQNHTETIVLEQDQ